MRSSSIPACIGQRASECSARAASSNASTRRPTPRSNRAEWVSTARGLGYRPQPQPMPDAIIFDMDGVLVDSEPLWRRAEKQVFATERIALTDEMCMQTMGWRLSEVVVHWLAVFDRPVARAPSLEAAIVDALCDLVGREGTAMPGVEQALELARRRNVAVALASSSAQRIIDTVLERLNLNEAFDAVCSAQFEQHGKPHPAVYMRAADAVGIPGPRCAAVEDSVPGLISACAARMRTIAVPEAHAAGDPRYAIADLRLGSLLELTDEVLDHLAGIGAN
ncbi:MAG: hexitol phosphatase HxpB [Myxococcales bacterium FL481]|nr:MAG: hexitol phosphatase HxpB [Myxococcales bacterium FL481]